MTITLTYAASTLSLPGDLLWVDEHSWAAVIQRQEYSITGALIVEAAAKQAGRPITLEATESSGWMPRADLGVLKEWADLAGQQFTLNLFGVDRTVVFDHAAGAISAQQIFEVSDPIDADPYAVTLRFIEV